MRPKSNRATSKDAATAYRIRQRGSKATREDLQWLKGYESKHPPRGGHRSRASGTEYVPPRQESIDRSFGEAPPPPEDLPPEPAQAREPLTSDPQPRPSPLPPAAAAPEYPVDFGGGSSFGAPAHSHGPICSIPNCPHHTEDGTIKKSGILGKCGVTGKVVYEPISENGARFFGGLVLFLMMYGAKVLRPDKALIEPTDDDMDDMAKAVRATIDRRAPSLAAWDDLAQLAFATGAYGNRALFGPAPPPERKP